MNKLFWGKSQLCYLNMLDGELLKPDICLKKVITEVKLCVCLFHENNDQWFSSQACMFKLPFPIFNVHKIK